MSERRGTTSPTTRRHGREQVARLKVSRSTAPLYLYRVGNLYRKKHSHMTDSDVLRVHVRPPELRKSTLPGFVGTGDLAQALDTFGDLVDARRHATHSTFPRAVLAISAYDELLMTVAAEQDERRRLHEAAAVLVESGPSVAVVVDVDPVGAQHLHARAVSDSVDVR